jgi:hypothetical protein
VCDEVVKDKKLDKEIATGIKKAIDKDPDLKGRLKELMNR